MKPILYVLKWYLLFWFFMLPVIICATYFFNGCSKSQWMKFMAESSDISFAILPLTGLISGLILAYYALKQIYLVRFKCYPKPKPKISKDELRDIIMSGGLSKPNDTHRDWFITRFNP